MVASLGTADALVIGAGPAGLTAALYLARFRRRVLVIDAGASRMRRIPRSHNVMGHPDGVPGAELLASFRRHAAEYPVRFETGRVERLERGDAGFVAHTGEARFSARLALLATGASDVEPPLPHAAQALQVGALRYCPVCDGFEALGQRVGVLADSARGVGEAVYLRHFTPRVTLFLLAGSPALPAQQLQRLHDHGLTLADGAVESLRHWGGTVSVRHGRHETDCDTVYAALGLRVHNDLAVRLGADVDGDGYLVTDGHQRTSVDGLYAAGDVAQSLNQISVACGEAAIAASAMHQALGV